MYSLLTQGLRHLASPKVWCMALLALSAGWANAQALKVEPPQEDPAPAGAAAPASGQMGGIKGANIFEIAPDANKDPKDPEQTNAERGKVQPGNNAPMWRDVGKGVTGYSSLPYPEAGNLIQPFVNYPGARLTNAGEAWRQVRNQWIIPYGGSVLLIVAVASRCSISPRARSPCTGSPPAA